MLLVEINFIGKHIWPAHKHGKLLKPGQKIILSYLSILEETVKQVIKESK